METRMFSFGLLVFLFGALALFGTLGLNVATPDPATINAGLMATRGMFVTAASALCIVGAIFMGCGAIRNELKRGKISDKKIKKGEKREPNLDHLPQGPKEASQNSLQHDFGLGHQKPQRKAIAS